jgi:hypothetical protein
MELLDTTKLTYKVGRKTKGLRAKPMVTLLVDRTVMAKFLVDTLEAKERRKQRRLAAISKEVACQIYSGCY